MSKPKKLKCVDGFSVPRSSGVKHTNTKSQSSTKPMSTRYKEEQISNFPQSQLGTEPGSFADLLCSSAMANMWTSSLKLPSNLSWPFSLSPTNLNFSPAGFKTLGPANRGNRKDRKKMSTFLASVVLLVLQESISWIMVNQLVITFTYHKVDQRLLLRNVSVFHIKQPLNRDYKSHLTYISPWGIH